MAILALVGGCGRFGYDAEAIDTIGLADGGSDPLAPDATPGVAVDGAVGVADAAIDGPVAADASVDAATLVVNGSYSAAPVVYSCAIGLVDLNFNSLVFADDSSTLTVTSNDVGAPAQPCTMVGSSAAGSGSFDVTCTLAGSGAEIYTLTGSFTSGDTWSGTFTADFVGSCLNCATQVFPLAGTRQ